MAVQTVLVELGYEIAAPHGTLEATTQQALRQFQHAHQLPDQGDLTSATLVAIVDAHCQHGCQMTVLVSATEETQGSQTPVTPIPLAGSGGWPLFVHGL